MGGQEHLVHLVHALAPLDCTPYCLDTISFLGSICCLESDVRSLPSCGWRLESLHSPVRRGWCQHLSSPNSTCPEPWLTLSIVSGSHCLHSLYFPNHVNLPLLDPLCLDDSAWEIIQDLVSHMAPTVIVIDLQNHEKDDAIVMHNLLIIHAPNQANRKALERVTEVHLD